MLENIGNTITRLALDLLGQHLAGRIPSHSPYKSAKMELPWQRPLPSNGALVIQQLWASGGRTRNQF